MGLVCGLLLAAASKYFAVEHDERHPLIVKALPGANCGACGYAGCSDFAHAVVGGKADHGGCPVGRSKTKDKITKIMDK